MRFSGKNVICNSCGAVMRKIDDDYIYCDECGNEGYLDEEDPEAPGQPMQMASPNGYSPIDYDGPDGGPAPDNWFDPEDL